MTFINRNLTLLLLAQMIFVAGSAMTVTMGGIVGAELTPAPELSTLPVSLTIVGTALGTIPASLFMQRFGRRIGFLLAALVAATAAMLAALALTQQSFWLYCTSTTVTGMTLAFSQQFRFAAAESVRYEYAANAIAFILLGSIGGAIIGPQLVASGQLIVTDKPFIGAVTGAAGLFLVAATLLVFYQNNSIEDADKHDVVEDPAPRRHLVSEPLFLLAIAAGVIGQGVMAFIMTAAPVSMHVVDGHDLNATAAVIRAHVLAMYMPSFISGMLISHFGERRLMLAGLAIFVVTIIAGLTGREVIHYGASMILLGLGWNFLFVGGTTLLVKTYHPSERYRAQAINEAAVFGTSALASLLAGTLLSRVGWDILLLSTLPVLLVMATAVISLRHRTLAIR